MISNSVSTIHALRKRGSVRKDTLAAVITLFYYIIFVISFFFTVALPALLRETSVRIGADSHTYIDIAKYLEATNQFTLHNAVSLSFNYFGPVLLLLLTDYNHTLILFLNIFLALISLKSLFRHYEFNRFWFIFFFVLNPITLLSLTTVNKEIFGLSSIVYLLVFMRSKNIMHLAIALILAVMTRWQQVVFTLAFVLYIEIIKSNKRANIFGPIVVLLAISSAYPFLGKLIDFTGDESAENIRSQFAQAGGVVPFLNNLQDNFMYWVAFVPKALLNFVGNFPRVIKVFDPNDAADFYNRMLVGHQICMLIVLIIIVFQWRIQAKSATLQMIVLYSILYCIALSINYRYFYPLYPIFLLIITMANIETEDRKLRSAI